MHNESCAVLNVNHALFRNTGHGERDDGAVCLVLSSQRCQNGQRDLQITRYQVDANVVFEMTKVWGG